MLETPAPWHVTVYYTYETIVYLIQVLLILEGAAHAYVFGSPYCKKWDTAAPEAIVEAAGGKLTGIK